eukprot:scaffold4489_cov165-Amphora_coffeaeformis.AAC.7
MFVNLSESILQNNAAVSDLQAGKLKDAAVSLKEAIESLRRLVTQAGEEEGEKGAQSKQRPDAPCVHFLQEQNSVFDASFSSVNLEDLTDDCDKIRTGISSVPITTDGSTFQGPLIYESAFSINEAEERQDLVCAVVFYNLALVQHQRNVNRGRNLRKVLSLYEKAAGVAQNLPLTEDSILLLHLAISNNIIQIHAMLFDHSSLEKSLVQMRVFVGERPTEDDDRFEFFVLNAICFGTDHMRCASAA